LSIKPGNQTKDEADRILFEKIIFFSEILRGFGCPVQFKKKQDPKILSQKLCFLWNYFI